MAGDRRPVLPLDRGSIRRLAVIGANAANTQIQGGGSAGVSPHHTVTVLDGVRAACGEGIEVEHEPGCAPHRGIPPLDVRQLTADDGSVGMTISYARGDVPGGATVFTEVTRRTSLTWMGEPAPGVTAGDFTAVGHAVFTPTCSGVHTWSLSSAGRSRLYLDGQVVVDNWEPAAGGTSFFGAGSPPVEGTAMLEDARGYDLRVELSAAVPLAGVRLGCQRPVPADQLERAVALAAASDAAIVVVGTTPEWESEGFDRRTLALPGAQDELVARVAAANPRCVVVLNTGAPVSAPWADAVPAVMQLWFAGQEAGHAAADVLFGEVNPSGRLPTTFPVRLEDTAGYLDLPGEDGRVRYSEGVFMGYRWHDARDIAPRWCFGHGLSYTSFEYGQLSARVTGSGAALRVDVAVAVTNVGQVPGRETVQVYVGDAPAPHGLKRPRRELRAFAGVHIDQGATAEVRLTLGAEGFRRWDPVQGGWVVDPGPYELAAGASSRDLRTRATVTIPEADGDRTEPAKRR